MDSIQLTMHGNFDLRCWSNYTVTQHLSRVLLATLDRSVYDGNMAVLDD